jgi:hypothetical protein
MSENPRELNGWPISSRQMGTVEQIHAIGQISLMHNFLQEALELLFRLCMPTERDFSTTLFHNLNNRDRLDLVKAIIDNNETEGDVKEALLSSILHYDICTESRNVLMHANFEISDLEIFQFSKRASKQPLKKPNAYRIPTADLRRIADEMDTTFSFILDLHRWLMQSRADSARPLGSPTILMGNGERPPLPKTPPKPRSLTKFEPPEVPEGEPL